MTVATRPLTIGDAATVRAICLAAVAGTGAHYTDAQRRAWASGLADLSAWQTRLERQSGIMALRSDVALGFMTLGEGGYLDMAFVHPDAAGQGIGRALHEAIRAMVRDRGAATMTTHASLAARPFFTALGWTVTGEEQVQRQGQMLRRFSMTRDV